VTHHEKRRKANTEEREARERSELNRLKRLVERKTNMDGEIIWVRRASERVENIQEKKKGEKENGSKRKEQKKKIVKGLCPHCSPF